ncbi:MAG: PQQ-binding-like beta-propeller repeat protein [Phycisphaerae bacterium]
MRHSVLHFPQPRQRFLRTRGPLCLVLGLLIAAPLAPAAPGRQNWPMFRGGPQLTGVVRGKLGKRLKVLWRFEAADAFLSSAAIVDGAVYVGCDDGFLYALNLSDGKLRWKYETKELIHSSPTVLRGVVYIGDDLGILHAVDAATGRRRWTFEAGDQIISSVNHHGDRLLFGSYDGLIYCLSAGDGKLIWKFETQGRVHGTPGIASGNVLAAGCDEYLHVLRLSDGTAVTKVSMGSVSGASAAVAGSRVFVGTYSGSVLGIDWKSGRKVWSFHDPQREFPYLSSAAVTDKLVIIGGRDKRLHALDAGTGKQRWLFETQGRVESSPVVVGKRVFFGSLDGNLYAVDLETGRQVWRFEAGSPISASPAVADGRLVVGTEDGVLYCFGSD